MLLSDQVGHMKRIATILLLASVYSFMYAGPFGIEMGWTLDACIRAGSVMDEIFPGKYHCHPPKAHTTFDSYIINIDETQGVYMITACSSAYESVTYGYYVEHEYNKVKEQLEQKYGIPRAFNYVNPSDSDPKDWMRTIFNENRALKAFWDEPNDSSIGAIWLEVKGISPTSCIISVEYLSNTLNSISNRIEKEDYDAL